MSLLHVFLRLRVLILATSLFSNVYVYAEPDPDFHPCVPCRNAFPNEVNELRFDFVGAASTAANMIYKITIKKVASQKEYLDVYSREGQNFLNRTCVTYADDDGDPREAKEVSFGVHVPQKSGKDLENVDCGTVSFDVNFNADPLNTRIVVNAGVEVYFDIDPSISGTYVELTAAVVRYRTHPGSMQDYVELDGVETYASLQDVYATVIGPSVTHLKIYNALTSRSLSRSQPSNIGSWYGQPALIWDTAPVNANVDGRIKVPVNTVIDVRGKASSKFNFNDGARDGGDGNYFIDFGKGITGSVSIGPAVQDHVKQQVDPKSGVVLGKALSWMASIVGVTAYLIL